MTDAQWVYIRSWHIVRSHPFGDSYLTLCGKVAGGPEYDTLAQADAARAGRQRTCESCLKIWVRQQAA